MVYIYFITSLFIILLIPRSNFLRWDSLLKRRFLQFSVYVGIIFLAFAIYLSLSDTLNYEILKFSGNKSFTDFAINFNQSQMH